VGKRKADSPFKELKARDLERKLLVAPDLVDGEQHLVSMCFISINHAEEA